MPDLGGSLLFTTSKRVSESLELSACLFPLKRQIRREDEGRWVAGVVYNVMQSNEISIGKQSALTERQ